MPTYSLSLEPMRSRKSWLGKKWTKSGSLAEFIAVSRPGHNLELPEAPEGNISVLEVPALSISSTNIRQRAGASKPIWYLVPDGVVQYIAQAQAIRGGVLTTPMTRRELRELERAEAISETESSRAD